ncbi:FecCD family ABC transporter permease [Corynebacterium mayonis]|uniref:FecCD family ABC transporter permease n=1 Tax=Corynebacterium mayonis TaxID=3062461 RepID=UPI003140AB5E
MQLSIPARVLASCLASILLIAVLWVLRLQAVVVPDNAPQLASEVHAVARDRLLSATIIGMSLGAAGVLLRTATRNPLADPEITGVNSGAAFGAVTATALLGTNAGVVLPGALAGACVAAAITVGVGLGMSSGDASGAGAIQRMVLLGIAISALFSALTSIVLVLDEAQLSTVLSWLSGRLGGVRMGDIWPSMVAVAVVVPLAFVAARGFDLLGAGDATAASVGARPRIMRVTAVIFAVLLVAPAVAAAGPIGFLGLMSAVVAERLAGPRHRFLLILAPLIGAAVLLVADAIAQALWAPAETPVGVVTSLAGVPLLLWGINRLGTRQRSRSRLVNRRREVV